MPHVSYARLWLESWRVREPGNECVGLSDTYENRMVGLATTGTSVADTVDNVAHLNAGERERLTALLRLVLEALEQWQGCVVLGEGCDGGCETGHDHNNHLRRKEPCGLRWHDHCPHTWR